MYSQHANRKNYLELRGIKLSSSEKIGWPTAPSKGLELKQLENDKIADSTQQNSGRKEAIN